MDKFEVEFDTDMSISETSFGWSDVHQYLRVDLGF